MSKAHRVVLLASLLLGACGSDDPVTYEQVLLNDGITIAAGASSTVLFSVDLTEVRDLSVNGYMQANGDIQVLLLTEAEFDKWSASQAFTSLYDSGQLDLVEFELAVNASGRYVVLISNAHDTVASKEVAALVTVRFQEP